MKKILLSPDPADPGAPAPSPDPVPVPVPAPAPGLSAAEIVLAGKKTERELKLEKDLKDRETRLAELEDENRGYKEALKPAPQPQPKKSSPWTYWD